MSREHLGEDAEIIRCKISLFCFCLIRLDRWAEGILPTQRIWILTKHLQMFFKLPLFTREHGRKDLQRGWFLVDAKAGSRSGDNSMEPLGSLQKSEWSRVGPLLFQHAYQGTDEITVIFLDQVCRWYETRKWGQPIYWPKSLDAQRNLTKQRWG